LNLAQSQELITYPLFPPESREHSDLNFLEEELSGKRLVMLGEMTHMYGNIFEIKIRVFEYLHEELGYNTIAMESPMYGLWLMNKTTGFTPSELNLAIYSVWSGTSEFQRLVNYIIENKIKVIGFDSQMDNSLQFTDDFFDYCHNQNINIRLNEDDMGILIEGILDIVKFDNSDIEYVDLEKELLRIIDQIGQLKPTDQNYYWSQFTKSLLACSKDAFYNTEYIQSNYFVDFQLNYRDKQMADNLLSYMARNMDEKIVLWADNIHIINSMESVENDTLNAFIPMGSLLKMRC